jgi:multicomponent Na+:H+ antiporter subunit E
MPDLGSLFRVAAVLFATWTLLSGKFDAAHLGAGAAASIVIAFATGRLWALPPAFGAVPGRPLSGVRWARVPRYTAIVAWEIVVSSAQVAYLVLHPRLPINPQLVRFRSGLPHTLARLTFANSITLTPGTVTLDVQDDEFLVHALRAETAQDVEHGRMRRYVGGLFDGGAASGAGGGVA